MPRSSGTREASSEGAAGLPLGLPPSPCTVRGLFHVCHAGVKRESDLSLRDHGAGGVCARRDLSVTQAGPGSGAGITPESDRAVGRVRSPILGFRLEGFHWSLLLENV